jgi:hypothetical protein
MSLFSVTAKGFAQGNAVLSAKGGQIMPKTGIAPSHPD